MHDSKLLSLNLTRELSQAQWLKLLEAADKVKIIIRVGHHPEITLPIELNDSILNRKIQSKATPAKSRILICEDPHHRSFTDEAMAWADSNRLDISFIRTITECNVADLTFSKPGKLERDGIYFDHYVSTILKALEHGDTVLLRGEVTDKNIDALTDLLSGKIYDGNGIIENNGQLILLTDKESLDKLTLTQSIETIQLTDQPEKITISRLNENTTVETTSDEFVSNRLTMLKDTLSSQHIVPIYGKTSVGKTMFMRQLASCLGPVFFDDIQSFVECKLVDNEIITLVIDEFNLVDKHRLDLLDLMFGFISNGYSTQRVSPNHRIVMLGNEGYSGRIKPRLLNYLAQVIEFKPMAQSYIDHKLIRPIFNGHPETDKCMMIILMVYQWACDHSGKELLLTPRELQMMALASRADTPFSHAQIAYVIAKAVIPDEHHVAFDEFMNKNFSDACDFAPNITPIEGFTCTENWAAPIAAMQIALAVRQLKLEDTTLEDYPGLGGVLLEGTTSLGKTTAIKNLLKQARIEPANIVYVNSTLPLAIKREKIKNAIRDNHILVIDEFNLAQQLLERDLNNALLNGLVLLGTQNPASKFEGRQGISHAIAHRLSYFKIRDYSPAEIHQFAQQRLTLERDEKLEPPLRENIRKAVLKTLNFTNVRELPPQIHAQLLHTPHSIINHFDMYCTGATGLDKDILKLYQAYMDKLSHERQLQLERLFKVIKDGVHTYLSSTSVLTHFRGHKVYARKLQTGLSKAKSLDQAKPTLRYIDGKKSRKLKEAIRESIVTDFSNAITHNKEEPTTLLGLAETIFSSPTIMGSKPETCSTKEPPELDKGP